MTHHDSSPTSHRAWLHAPAGELARKPLACVAFGTPMADIAVQND
jgi:hypothetical protein